MIKINGNWLKEYKVHIIVWTIFITYETVVIGLVFNIFGNPFTYLLHYIVIVSFFYFCSEKGLPWAFNKNRFVWWRLPSMFALALTLYIILHYLADLSLISTGVIEQNGVYTLSYQFILKNLYRGSYFLGFSTGYYLLKMRDIERVEREKLKQLNFENILKRQEMEKELSVTQNAFLKAQINPHFLFNTLDFVYHSIDSNPGDAADAIIYLSRMMRFALDSNEQGGFIRLGEEIRHVQTLLNLYQLRKKNAILPMLIYSQEVADLLFIPLILLTLAENMIKHGLFNETTDSSYINLQISAGILRVETKNAIDRQSSKILSGAGLENIERRIRFAYGDESEFLFYEDQTSNFITKISIPIFDIDK